MACAISIEKRLDIIKHKQAEESNANIAKWLFVTERTIRRIWNKYCTTGRYEAEPKNSGRKPKVSDEMMTRITERIKEIPDITLQEIIDEFDLSISESALCRRLIKLGLRYKKNSSSQRANA